MVTQSSEHGVLLPLNKKNTYIGVAFFAVMLSAPEKLLFGAPGKLLFGAPGKSLSPGTKLSIKTKQPMTAFLLLLFCSEVICCSFCLRQSFCDNSV